MPTWVLTLLIIALALPGALIVLGGVAAMFFAPAAYDQRIRWLNEGKCGRCGSGETIEGSPICPGCGKSRRDSFASKPPGGAEQDQQQKEGASQ